MPSKPVRLVAALVVAAALMVCLPTRAQVKRPMTLVDLLSIPRISGDAPQITRDGRRILFTMLTTDWAGNRRVPEVWLVNANGTGAHRLTSPEMAASGSRWSPDGATIAVVSRGNIFLIPSGGGSAKQLSHHASPVGDIAWSPDGSAIYFVATDPPTAAGSARERARGDMVVLDEFRQRHLWRITIGDANETRITSGDYTIAAYKIARNGKQIVVSRRPSPLPIDTDKMEVWSLNADGSGAIQITHNEIPEEEGELSPDGTQVLFLARANGRQEPYYNENLFLAASSGKGNPHVMMPDFPYEVLRATWSDDGKTIFIVANMGVHSELFEVDVASGKPKQLTTGDHAIVHPFWSVNGERQVFLVDEPTRIGDIWLFTRGASAPVRVTGIYDYLDRDFALPRQERITWKGADGAPVEGVLSYPIDFKPGMRYPLVVQLHGGPEDSDRFGWGQIFLNYQPAWTARGYAVLRPNYRGSSGYGNTSYREPIGGYFKNSHLDVIAGVDRVIAMGVADPDRVALMGWSAGAHLVNKLITFTGRFKAASSYAGVANWISLYGESDTRAERDLWFGGTLWQKNAPIQAYWDQSPLKYITQARTPTIFFIGAEDTRVPMAQSVEMSRALKAQHVASELHIAPGEGHTWTKPVHQLYKMNHEIEWFEKYVRDLPYTPEPVPSTNAAAASSSR